MSEQTQSTADNSHDEETDAQQESSEEQLPSGAIELPIEEMLADMQAQRDDALGRYQRALADFQNFQRRSAVNEQKARLRAKADLIRELLPALENIDIICAQDPKTASERTVQEGVRMAREEILKALAAHGATRIEAGVGDEFDPNRHEAMMHIQAQGVEPNHIAQQIQVGYQIGDLVIRPAKVAVARESDVTES